MSVQVALSRSWIPAAVVEPEKEVPVCARVMEKEPPSLKVHPFDPVPDHAQVPVQVPVKSVPVVIWPVPDKSITMGSAGEVPLMPIAACSVLFEGVKITEMVHDADASRAPGQSFVW
jgi:hypothetical protein